MTLSSMTGFASASGSTAALQWSWEIKTVNARNLDLRVRVPAGYDAVDAAARPLITSALTRGTCYCTLNINRASSAIPFRVNEAALEAAIAALETIRGRIDAAPPSLDGILSLRGVLDMAEPEASAEVREAETRMLLDGLRQAVDALIAARHAEGAVLRRILLDRLDVMTALRDQAENAPGRTPEAIRERLAAQVRTLVETGAGLDPERLHQEALLMAAKADIREELDRLAAHIAAARELIEQGGAVGRRLDFLAQEMGREANTLCAKSNDVSLTRTGLELKAIVEQFREQVQNVE